MSTCDSGSQRRGVHAPTLVVTVGTGAAAWQHHALGPQSASERHDGTYGASQLARHVVTTYATTSRTQQRVPAVQS